MYRCLQACQNVPDIGCKTSELCWLSDKEAADKLSRTVDEACLLLAEYNGRLAAELEDRRQLARMLTEYIHSQKEALVEREKKLEVSVPFCSPSVLLSVL